MREVLNIAQWCATSLPKEVHTRNTLLLVYRHLQLGHITNNFFSMEWLVLDSRVALYRVFGQSKAAAGRANIPTYRDVYISIYCDDGYVCMQ